MFALTFSVAILLYLSLTLIALLIIWGWNHYRGRNKKKDLNYDQALKVCEYCHYTYLEEVQKSISKCPQCQSFNKDHLISKD